MSRVRTVRGFTLIEMLVVIAIILIMAGVVLKTTGLVLRSTAKGKATHDLQQLQNALNEYYAEYGSYPPCDTMVYIFEGGQTRDRLGIDWLGDNAFSNPTNTASFIPDMVRSGWPQGVPGKSLGYQYGLYAYLWPREVKEKCLPVGADGKPVERKQAHWYDFDSERDINAKKKWASYLVDLDVGETKIQSEAEKAKRNIMLHADVAFTNSTRSVIDPWGRDYRYESKPPYQNYSLWSLGPDEANSADDLNADASFRNP